MSSPVSTKVAVEQTKGPSRIRQTGERILPKIGFRPGNDPEFDPSKTPLSSTIDINVLRHMKCVSIVVGKLVR